MKKTLLLLTATALLCTYSCKKKKVEEPQVQVVEVKKDTVPEVQPEPEPVVIDEGVNLDDKYFIVVGSYTVESFAKERSVYFKEKGLKPGIVMKNDDGWYRLAVKSFDEKKAADNALVELQKTDKDFLKAWVLTK
ncbi:hypothetical protein EMN47_05875 [Prolixibacteraceae bacterium JC049]|nr:hypothetical protein [Prolixibacteraceae bacterium JC049]